MGKHLRSPRDLRTFPSVQFQQVPPPAHRIAEVTAADITLKRTLKPSPQQLRITTGRNLDLPSRLVEVQMRVVPDIAAEINRRASRVLAVEPHRLPW